LLAAPAVAAEKHSGRIVDVREGAIVLEELGAARGPEPALQKRTVALQPQTAVTLAERSDQGADGWPGGFRPEPLSVQDLRPGDFATVTAERADGRLVARDVTVVRPKAAP